MILSQKAFSGARTKSTALFGRKANFKLPTVSIFDIK